VVKMRSAAAASTVMQQSEHAIAATFWNWLTGSPSGQRLYSGA
jgi:hypothetical protein